MYFIFPYLLGPKSRPPSELRCYVSAFRQNTPDSPTVWTSSNNSTQPLSSLRRGKRPNKHMLNVISCFVAAFCLFFFFLFTILLFHPSDLLTPGDVVKRRLIHTTEQIYFCLNWSLGVTLERYLDSRRGKGIFLCSKYSTSKSVCTLRRLSLVFLKGPCWKLWLEAESKMQCYLAPLMKIHSQVPMQRSNQSLGNVAKTSPTHEIHFCHRDIGPIWFQLRTKEKYDSWCLKSLTFISMFVCACLHVFSNVCKCTHLTRSLLSL